MDSHQLAHPSEEIYINAVEALVHYIYLQDERVRESEQRLAECIAMQAFPTEAEIHENLALKGQAILNYLSKVKEESNLQ